MSPIRKRRRFSRTKPREVLAGIAGLCLLAVFAGALRISWNFYHSVYMQPMAYAVPPPPTFPAARRLYPFSIIPGGVYDPAELARRLQLDPMLAEHYRDIRMDNLVAIRLPAPIQAYVSFRQGSQIRWTSKALTIPRGELVLTDGAHMIRSRCGNRIQQKKPPTEVNSSAMTEETQNMIFDTPLPSIVNLPPPLQPVVSPGVVAGDLWKEPGHAMAVVPEPETLILFASGSLLALFGTFICVKS